VSTASELLEIATKAAAVPDTDILRMASDLTKHARNAATRSYTTLYAPLPEKYAKEPNYSRLVAALRADGFLVVDCRGSVFGGGDAIRLDWSNAK